MYKLQSRFFLKLVIFVTFFLFISTFYCCSKSKNQGLGHGNNIDTLKVVTLYGPTSYFDYRGVPMGIDYENIRRFSEEENIILEITTVKNINELIEKLKSGEAHLAAYPVPIISEYSEEVIHCGPKETSTQVLVQKKDDNMVHDVTELIGKNIYVEKDTKYHYRLDNLNDELGGGINIITINDDTISSEDILRLVNNGELEYAVIDSQLASLYKDTYSNLDTSLKLSSEQSASWAVGAELDSLAAKIDRWDNQTHTSEFVKEIYKRYYDRNMLNNTDSNLEFFKKMKLSNGKIVSPYDQIFKKYAEKIDIDWKLLAAIAYCESRFNPSVESRFGAYGLMQVMPNTANSVGVDPGALRNPESNILAATLILSKLNNALENKIEDSNERIKFIVAAYNSGLGHIYDSISLAEKYGLDSQKWTGNVGIAALMKSRPEYYNDPVVNHGYFRGRETVDFVEQVMSIYSYLKTVLK